MLSYDDVARTAGGRQRFGVKGRWDMASSNRGADDNRAFEKLGRKLRRNPSALLTDAEALLLARELRKAFADAFPLAPAQSLLDAERGVRWHALGERCRQARAERGWSLKDAAAAAGIPHYRARAVEGGHLGSVRADLADRYFRALGIDAWVTRWVRANKALAESVGLIDPRRNRRRETKR